MLNYAESDDGITWAKPNLGKIEFDGNTANNIFHRPSLIPGCRAMESHGLIVDDVGGPERRYKIPVYHSFHGDADNGLYALFSPDGIHLDAAPGADLRAGRRPARGDQGTR